MCQSVGMVSKGQPPTSTTCYPPKLATTAAARTHRATWAQACAHRPTPTYQVSIWLLCPANLLHTQREGGQAHFHPGPNGFLSSFYPPSLSSHSDQKPSRRGPIEGSARGSLPGGQSPPLMALCSLDKTSIDGYSTAG